jgi:4-alpha-glucanotransferase
MHADEMIGSGGDKAARQDMFPTQVGEWQTQTRAGSPPIGKGSSFDVTRNPIQAQLKALSALRDQYPALSTGASVVRYASGPALVVSRFDVPTGAELVTAFNNGDSVTRVTVTTGTPGSSWTVPFGAGTATAGAGASLTLTIPPVSAMVARPEGAIPSASPWTTRRRTGHFSIRAAIRRVRGCRWSPSHVVSTGRPPSPRCSPSSPISRVHASMRSGEALFSVRGSGVLLHVTSLPGARLGPEAYEFVDWLEEAGQSWWQMLPLNPPDAFGSPYTSSSAFAGWRGLLDDPDAEVSISEIRRFRARHAYWAADWERYAGAGAVADQVRFAREWGALRKYAADHGIRLIGDIPIYVAEESAETASHPELFARDLVAGAAPDVSHPEGQLWGQPVYDWRAMRHEGYRWWIERFRRTLELVDVARVDHFRGFVAYWAVPRGATSPLEGRWHRGPGAALFEAVEGELGHVPLIAEDLGIITAPVDRLRLRLGALGMRIVGRGFVKRHRHRHAVAAHVKDAVVYTGTHDHPTLAGWLATASEEDLALVHHDLAEAGIEDDDLEWALVRLALSSRARLAILPMQDVLGLGEEARMNRPGTVGNGNWRWRLQPGQLTADVAARLRDATAESRRLAPVRLRATA